VYRRKQAIGRFLPKLSLSARYSRVSHVEPGSLSLPAATIPGQPTATNTVQLGEAVDDQVSLRLSVDQPLFTGFALWNGYRATEHVEALARQRVRADRADVRAVAQEAYFNLLKARQLREVTRQLVQALEEHLQQVRSLHGAGRATELDVSRENWTAPGGSKVTAGLVQHSSDGSYDDHHVLLQHPAGKLQCQRFLGTALKDGAPSILPAN